MFTAGAEYLVTTRDQKFDSPRPFIGGPDSSLVNIGNLNFEYQSGVRGFLALSSSGVRVEGIYSHYGTWNSGSSGSLTQGLSFDEGITGAWAGSDFINMTTGFKGLHAASAAGMGGDADEFEGLGPATGFAGDALPTYEVYYKSVLQTFELNVVTEDPNAHFQFGAGYRNLQLDESSEIAITGTLRAVDNLAANGGISHNSLTTFGRLDFLGGTANGFEDETRNPSGVADVLQMHQSAKVANNLNGVQFIFQDEIMYWRGWTIDGVVKAGLYHNRATGSVSETYIGTDPVSGESSTYGRTFDNVKDTLAFAGTVGIKSNFPLSDHWSLTSGYEMMFLHGVAISPDQYNAVRGTTLNNRVYSIDTHGQVLAHGANVGLQFCY